MRRIWCGLACSLIVFGLIELRQSPATAESKEPAGPGTVWVVRHADRENDSPDSPLKKPQGEDRAQGLKACLEGKGVTAIVTSDKKRTIQTAQPLAEKAGIRPAVVPMVETAEGIQQNIEGVAAKVRATPGNILVVGHSNTVGGIIKRLGGPPGLGNITVYHRLFELKFSDGPVAFEEMKYGVAPTNGKKQC